MYPRVHVRHTPFVDVYKSPCRPARRPASAPPAPPSDSGSLPELAICFLQSRGERRQRLECLLRICNHTLQQHLEVFLQRLDGGGLEELGSVHERAQDAPWPIGQDEGQVQRRPPFYRDVQRSRHEVSEP